MVGRQSFEIRTARQFLEGLVEPDYEEFLKEPSSSRLAIHCALGCWHLTEWVWADVLKGNTSLCSAIDASIRVNDFGSFCAYAVTTCSELDIMRQIADGSKHFGGQSSTVRDSSLAGGAFDKGFSAGFDIGQLEVEMPGGKRRFTDCLEAAVGFWRAFFSKHVA